MRFFLLTASEVFGICVVPSVINIEVNGASLPVGSAVVIVLASVLVLSTVF